MTTHLQPIQWPAEAIWEAVYPLLPQFSVEVLPEIDSTNSELMRRAKAGQFEPILLVAEKQTAGRGRLGRQWHDLAERTESIPMLTFSLGMPLEPADWSGLSLAVGVSVAQSLHPDIGLKWPNDLWIHDRKLAGILIETCTFNQQKYAVIGVGINISKPQDSHTNALAQLRRTPAWLQELLPLMTAPEALRQIAPTLIQTLLTFSAQGFAPFQKQFNQRDILLGRQIVVDDNLGHSSTKTSGIAIGVNPRGELQINTKQGMKSINSSEVSIQPHEIALN